MAKEFVLKALSVINNGHKVAMFLKLQFLETKGRKQLFIDHPLVLFISLHQDYYVLKMVILKIQRVVQWHTLGMCGKRVIKEKQKIKWIN